MKKLVIGIMLLGSVHNARADLFGGDVAVLTQILIQAIQQLAQLRQIFDTASDTLQLTRDINRGINDSLNLLKHVQPNTDPGLFRDWGTVAEAVRQVEASYGRPPTSPEAQIQKDVDQGVAEAIAANNQFYKYSIELDGIAEQIQQYSHSVSPGGAQKLTAQSLGLMIQVLNQNLRAQSTLLKLQAQDMAVRNRREKSETNQFLSSASSLSTAMRGQDVNFVVPRF